MLQSGLNTTTLFVKKNYVSIQYTPCGFPTFRKTLRKSFRAENLPVFPKSVFLGVFSIFPPWTFYRPSEDKLRDSRRFSSAGLGENKMAAIDDFSIKQHLAWQCLCSCVKQCNRHIHLHVYKCSCHFLSLSLSLSLSLLCSHEIVKRYTVIMLSMNPCLLSTANSLSTYM